MKDSLLHAHVVVKTWNLVISRRRYATYRKKKKNIYIYIYIYFPAQTYTIISYIGGNLLWIADQLEHSDAILTAENVRFSSELAI